MTMAIELAKALAPLAATLLGTLSRLFGGASDEEAQILWRQVEAEIGTTGTRLHEVQANFARRDTENDARVKRDV